MLFTCICCLLLTVIVQSVKLEDYGDIDWQCVVDLDYEISRLSSNDLELVDKLSFLTVLYRHGNRYPSRSISSLIPTASDPEVTCNVNRVKSTYSYVGDDDKSGYGGSHYGLEIDYPFGYQTLPNSNCESTQISDNAVEQMIKTGEIIGERYFSNNNKNNGNSDQFKKRDRSADRILSDVQNFNRVIDSQVYLLQGLLGDNNNNNNNDHSRRLLGKGKRKGKGKSSGNSNNDDIKLITTEMYEGTELNPWYNWNGASYCRVNSAEFQDWYSRYTSIAQNSAALADYLSTQFVLDTISAFESEGGSYNPFAPVNLGFWYCTNTDIPLTEETFGDLMEVGRVADTKVDESINGSNANKCYYHQIMRTAYYQVYTRLMNALSDNNNKNMYIIGSQGLITRLFLWGLDMLPDRAVLKQGEVITFEIYLKSGEDGFMNDGITVDTSNYLFRFTRAGEFISYPPCETEYNNNGNSQLCELDTLLNAEYGFSDVISLDDWYNECQTAVTDCLCGFCD